MLIEVSNGHIEKLFTELNYVHVTCQRWI